MAIGVLKRKPDDQSFYSELREWSHSERMALALLGICFLNVRTIHWTVGHIYTLGVRSMELKS